VIGLSIHFENWIWIVNHIFVMDLNWIDNPKKNRIEQNLHIAKNDIKIITGEVCLRLLDCEIYKYY